ncbi:SDR family oxidoreductase [Chondromyces crocatus]|uniref:Thioester reductase (TE) domain-containing protein n=1 Tax=Chondromyces crocatus TaxID=52 RepID=A0A0K1EAN3_CHOCO|nr:SDR family oxidoreductase [Chondromyces crocatus]AKT37737.1 uncharacterized protein CMC5_018790 [Chondromyces crocatus]
MAPPGHDSVLLLTGLPSLYARKMVHHVLSAEPRTQIYALVAPRFIAPLTAEVEALGARERVVFLEGDVTSMDLGLSGAELRMLAREVDVIHHMAFTSDVDLDPAAAEALNVLGTAEVLEVARLCSSLSCLVHHSTAFVSGDRRGVVYEDELEHGQGFRSTTEATRMKAEAVMRQAMRDVPIAVVRPTTLVGDSETGEVDRLDGIYVLILMLLAAPSDLALPLPGKGDMALNVVPLDFVAKASRTIGRSAKAAGHTFHLADPQPLSARQVFELLAHAGGRRAPRGHIPSNLAKAMLRAPGIDRFARSPRAFVEQLMTPVRYDMRNTEHALSGTGLECPRFESYVETLVHAVEKHLREERARRQAELERAAEVEDPLS